MLTPSQPVWNLKVISVNGVLTPALTLQSMKIKNTKIREMVGTTPILHHNQQQRLIWFGNLTRMAPHQLASKAYNTKVSRHKARGRPRKTWIEGVKETLKTHNIPTTQAFKLAADRKLFLPSTPRMVLFCLLVAYRPSNMRVYLRDGSAQTILRAATLR